MAARLTNKSEHLAETETGSFSDPLGSEERIERLADHLVAHSRSGVANGEPDVLARSHLIAAWISTADAHIRGSDRQLPALGHGVARVDRQVEQGVFELPRVRAHNPDV